MLKKQLRIGFAILGLMVFFISCEKEITCELPTPCQENCELNPPSIMVCAMGVPTKYYFNKDTRQCEPYLHFEGMVPFETLQDCEDCSCTRLIPETGDK